MAVPISHAQIDRVANVLSQAFFNDPMFTYILPEEQRRLAPLKWFFKSGIRYGLSYGSVYTTHDSEGGAIWLRPGNTTIHFLGMLRSGRRAGAVLPPQIFLVSRPFLIVLRFHRFYPATILASQARLSQLSDSF